MAAYARQVALITRSGIWFGDTRIANAIRRGYRPGRFGRT
jgi:hypothetical protein